MADRQDQVVLQARHPGFGNGDGAVVGFFESGNKTAESDRYITGNTADFMRFSDAFRPAVCGIVENAICDRFAQYQVAPVQLAQVKRRA